MASTTTAVTAPVSAEILTARLAQEVAEYRATERGWTRSERLARQDAQARAACDCA